MGILVSKGPRALFAVVPKYVDAESGPIKGKFLPKGMTTRVATKPLSTISM